MKQIVRYCLTALLILGGCTNETVLLPSSSSPSDTDIGGRTPLIIRATASGFINAGQPGDSPTTRTPVEDGLATKFQPGDAIGIFCVRTDEHTNEYISEDIKNLKLVYTQTSDGTGIWRREPTDLFTIPMRKLMWRIPPTKRTSEQMHGTKKR